MLPYGTVLRLFAPDLERSVALRSQGGTGGRSSLKLVPKKMGQKHTS